MHDLKMGDLTIAVTAAQGALRLDWRGRSTDRQPEIVLTPFFREALDAAGAGGALELHFEALDHFNSSTITAIIGLVAQARARGVKLTLVYDPALRWQKLSFEALAVFRKDDGLLELRPSP